jgi:hypothetical protein
MVKMTAITDGHQYAGRVLSKGEQFDCEDRFVLLLVGLKRAEIAPQKYRTREMTAQRRRSKGA